MERIGLIGIGNIGSYYARRLLEDGRQLTVRDIDPAKMARAVEQGARAAASPALVARQADVMSLSLPGSRVVEQVMEGALVHETCKATRLHGDADWAQAGIVTYWRRLNAGAD